MSFLLQIKQDPRFLVWLWLIFINLAAFAAMGIDKSRAIRGKWRIPEKTLFLLVALGGGIGGIAGIYAFRHKTRRKKFTLGFPALLCLELALFACVYFWQSA